MFWQFRCFTVFCTLMWLTPLTSLSFSFSCDKFCLSEFAVVNTISHNPVSICTPARIAEAIAIPPTQSEKGSFCKWHKANKTKMYHRCHGGTGSAADSLTIRLSLASRDGPGWCVTTKFYSCTEPFFVHMTCIFYICPKWSLAQSVDHAICAPFWHAHWKRPKDVPSPPWGGLQRHWLVFWKLPSYQIRNKFDVWWRKTKQWCPLMFDEFVGSCPYSNWYRNLPPGTPQLEHWHATRVMSNAPKKIIARQKITIAKIMFS